MPTILSKSQIEVYKKFEETKIKDYTDSLLLREMIAKELILITELIGITSQNIPSKWAMKTIIDDFIINKYGHWAVSEIRLAFELALKEVISCPTEERFKDTTWILSHFQSLSIPYLERVFKAYQIYKDKTKIQVSNYIDDLHKKSKIVEDYPKVDKAIKEVLIQMYNEILTGKSISYLFQVNSHYEFMNQLGLIDFTADEKIKILNNCEMEIVQIEQNEKLEKRGLAKFNSKYEIKDKYDRARKKTVILQLFKFKEMHMSEELFINTLNKACFISEEITKKNIEWQIGLKKI